MNNEFEFMDATKAKKLSIWSNLPNIIKTCITIEAHSGDLHVTISKLKCNENDRKFIFETNDVIDYKVTKVNADILLALKFLGFKVSVDNNYSGVNFEDTKLIISWD